MARRKRAEIEEEASGETEGVSPLAPVLWSVSCLASALILYNIMLGQPPRSERLAMNGEASSQNTVVLKYEPDVEELQRELLATGHYKGLVDGVNGARTREAIFAYQRDNNLPASPHVTPALLEQVRFSRKIVDATEFTASTGATATPVKRNRTALLQEALASLGYDPGDITGEMNPTTRAAIRRFKSENGLTADGEVDGVLLAKLSRTTGFEGLADAAE
jgi:peptidoglycan hydrolase-like protein with peptidoglycan-binding domain